MQIQNCIVETDSQILVQACNGITDDSFFGIIVDDCVHLSKHINHVLIQFVYKSTNMVAREIASATYSMSDTGK